VSFASPPFFIASLLHASGLRTSFGRWGQSGLVWAEVYLWKILGILSWIMKLSDGYLQLYPYPAFVSQ